MSLVEYAAAIRNSIVMRHEGIVTILFLCIFLFVFLFLSLLGSVSKTEYIYIYTLMKRLSLSSFFKHLVIT